MGGFKVNRQVVWAIFDCDRTKTQRTIHAGIAGGQEWADSDDEDNAESDHGIFFMFAAKQK